ncbi:hypothetical protein [Colwellia sp. MEBiC06753]
MTNPIDDNIPSIKPDLDEVEAYRSTKSPSKASAKVEATSSTRTPDTPKKSSTLAILNSLVLYAAFAGGGYWFYQQDLKSTQALHAAEERIVDLEKQLSATDEEMGESTVAMRAKLEGLIEKTDKLWDEMDKLWASAWRRNQSEIKELRSSTIKAENNLKTLGTEVAGNDKDIRDLNEKNTTLSFSLDALTEQLAQAKNIQTSLNELNSKLVNLENKSSSRDRKQIELATMVADLDTSVKILIERGEQQMAKPQTNQP